ncbi:MAG: cell wall hydrolase [Clostridiales bacterium]|nr:cell wall hydrolase [Clostridiales bacterium]
MKTKNRRLLKFFGGTFFSVLTMASISTTAVATNSDYLSNWAVGVAVVLDNGTVQMGANVVQEQSGLDADDSQDPDSKESNLVMAKVKESLNVRTEPNGTSEKVGVLYKDCGGVILEQIEGWTKIQSGDVVGWANSDYLYFGEEAQDIAKEVGKLVATNKAEALRVRMEPSTEAEVLSFLALNETVDAYETDDAKWVSVEIEGQTGYVLSEFVDLDYHIDYGETMETIKEREAAEKASKSKVQGTIAGIPEGTTDTMLMAALIQCEAGGESYEGMLAVGAVVMNRVESKGYPNTIQGVIFASGQFTPAMSGKVNRIIEAGKVRDICIQAAEEAISGVSNVGEATRFRRVGNREGLVIGNHVFW